MNRSVWFRWLVRLLVGSCFLGMSWSGCVLEPLLLDCYRCPCGSPDYVCAGGFCVSKNTQSQLSAQQLRLYVLEQCVQNTSNDGGQEVAPPPESRTPPEPVVTCRCPDGYLCNKTTGACTNPCDGVNCPDGFRCVPQAGQCVKERINTNDCRQDASLCRAPTCCHPGVGACVTDCRTCNKCAEGYTCDERNGRCTRESSTCEIQVMCESRRDCCEQNCYRVEESGYRHGSCECRLGGRECPRGQLCLPVTNTSGDLTYTCTCQNNAQCAPNGVCLRHPIWLGIRTCALRIR